MWRHVTGWLGTNILRQTVNVIFHGQKFFLHFLTIKDETTDLSQNIGQYFLQLACIMIVRCIEQINLPLWHEEFHYLNHKCLDTENAMLAQVFLFCYLEYMTSSLWDQVALFLRHQCNPQKLVYLRFQHDGCLTPKTVLRKQSDACNMQQKIKMTEFSTTVSSISLSKSQLV